MKACRLRGKKLGAGRCRRGCCASTRPMGAVISANVTLMAAKTKPVSKCEIPVNLIVMETFGIFVFEEQKYQLWSPERGKMHLDTLSSTGGETLNFTLYKTALNPFQNSGNEVK